MRFWPALHYNLCYDMKHLTEKTENSNLFDECNCEPLLTCRQGLALLRELRQWFLRRLELACGGAHRGIPTPSRQ